MIIVELTPYEARALCNVANLFGDVLAKEIALPDGHTVRPLHSAAMKLEVALTQEQESL